METQTLQPSDRPSARAGRSGDSAQGPHDAFLQQARPRRSLTIGAVCKLLKREFPDISISKIRYLEDQKLLSPRRTQGGYRLYSSADVSRLRTILRLQRDEFLPLRVIRRELAAGRSEGDVHPPGASPEQRVPRRAQIVPPFADAHALEEVVEYTGVDEGLIRELEEYGVVRGELRDGLRYYDDVEREIVRAVGELTRYGVAGRNLRVFRISADREAALVEQILAPALHSRNSERRKEAIETLENLAAVVSHLKHLLLVRYLRKLVA